LQTLNTDVYGHRCLGKNVWIAPKVKNRFPVLGAQYAAPRVPPTVPRFLSDPHFIRSSPMARSLVLASVRVQCEIIYMASANFCWPPFAHFTSGFLMAKFRNLFAKVLASVFVYPWPRRDQTGGRSRPPNSTTRSVDKNARSTPIFSVELNIWEFVRYFGVNRSRRFRFRFRLRFRRPAFVEQGNGVRI